MCTSMPVGFFTWFPAHPLRVPLVDFEIQVMYRKFSLTISGSLRFPFRTSRFCILWTTSKYYKVIILKYLLN